MIISHKYKFVWIHIPKCAGHWMRDLLLKIDPDIDDYRRVASKPSDKNHPIRCWHVSYSYFQNHHPLYEQIKDYTFFTFIRNPIDRAISEYNMILNTPQHIQYSSVSKISVYDFMQGRKTRNIQVEFVLDRNGVISPNIKILSYEKIKDIDFLEKFFRSLGVEDNENLKNICSGSPIFVGTPSIKKSQLDYERLKECWSPDVLWFYLYHS